MRVFLTAMASALCVLAAPIASAQMPDGEPAFMKALYPPELIIQNQRVIELTRQQRADIIAIVKAFQAEASEMQWAMLEEQQKLEEILLADSIAKDAALAQAETVLRMEAQFKLAHLELLLALKNGLTEEQIELLSQIRDAE